MDVKRLFLISFLIGSLIFEAMGEANLPKECGISKTHGLQGCTPKTSRIIGGVEAVNGEIPWQASLDVSNGSQYFTTCGAVVVSSQYLLTAAHCLKYKDEGVMWEAIAKFSTIKVGDTHMFIGNEIYNISSFFIHPNYTILEDENKTIYKNDIALVQLTSNISFNDNVTAICLPESKFTVCGSENVVISGWGLTEEHNETDDHYISFPFNLQRANIQTIAKNDSRCIKSNNGTEIDDTVFCTDSRPKGSYPGDMGGPVSIEHSGKCVLAGLISNEEYCEKDFQSGLNVNIVHFLEWIYETIRTTARDGVSPS
ncbi:ST14 [Lepeophtheirus salmonis]|uniref:ST14 n=1 Tax=Lepeophtheirus salmonis TaxID=72036 RepID=A0A7R8D016_LEPSM|nr:ST14 [Lepeophtheirus salmonis]CAF2979341.1 ST14 [Lepeophtheirus salmonis]